MPDSPLPLSEAALHEMRGHHRSQCFYCMIPGWRCDQFIILTMALETFRLRADLTAAQRPVFPKTTPTGFVYNEPTTWKELSEHVMNRSQGIMEQWAEDESAPAGTTEAMFTIAWNESVRLAERLEKAEAALLEDICLGHQGNPANERCGNAWGYSDDKLWNQTCKRARAALGKEDTNG